MECCSSCSNNSIWPKCLPAAKDQTVEFNTSTNELELIDCSKFVCYAPEG